MLHKPVYDLIINSLYPFMVTCKMKAILLSTIFCLALVNADFKFLSDKDVERIEQEWDKDEEVHMFIVLF